MKNIIIYTITLFPLIFVACKPKHNPMDSYGYFIDSLTRKPIQGVLVRHLETNVSAISDSSGYFEIAYQPNTLHLLSFYKKEYINDTINIFFSFDANFGCRSFYLFNGGKILLKKQIAIKNMPIK